MHYNLVLQKDGVYTSSEIKTFTYKSAFADGIDFKRHLKESFFSHLTDLSRSGYIIPLPSNDDPKNGSNYINITPSLYAKALFINYMTLHNISRNDLSKNAGIHIQEVNRIYNFDHTTKIDSLEKYLSLYNVKFKITMDNCQVEYDPNKTCIQNVKAYLLDLLEQSDITLHDIKDLMHVSIQGVNRIFDENKPSKIDTLENYATIFKSKFNISLYEISQ